MEFPEKINFNETLSLYEGRKPDLEESPDIESLNFVKESVQSKMSQMAKKVFSSYTNIRKDAEGIVTDNNETWKKRVPVLTELVDEKIPLTLFAMKTFVLDKNNGEEVETISFDLVRGKIEGNTTEDLYKKWKSSFSEGNNVSTLVFIDKGDLFDLVDRETNSKFRGQGFGTMLLKASEDFVQERSTEKQKTTTIHADAAQLDVITWLYNKGYQAQNEEDENRLNEVLNGNKDIKIGEKNYILKNAPEEPLEDFNDAYRIKFTKETPAKISSSVTEVQNETHGLIENI